MITIPVESLDGFPSDTIIALLVKRLGGKVVVPYDCDEINDATLSIFIDTDGTVTLTVKEEPGGDSDADE